jgi:hypothetical protein
LWVLLFRRVYPVIDAEPVSHHLDIAEGNASLYHAKRAGIHAYEHSFQFWFRVGRDIALVGYATIL